MAAQDNEPPSLQAGAFFVNDAHHVTHKVVKLGKVFPHPEDMDATCLGETTVVTLPVGDETLQYRAVAVADNGRCNLYALSPDEEETLIQRAVEKTPHMKVSWTRWAAMTKSNLYPADATDAERAVFGLHCILGAAVMEKRADLKRARDAASRKKRARAITQEADGAAPAPKRIAPPEPPTIIKLEPESPQGGHEPGGTIKLTLEVPAVTQKMVQAALAGMAAAMTS